MKFNDLLILQNENLFSKSINYGFEYYTFLAVLFGYCQTTLCSSNFAKRPKLSNNFDKKTHIEFEIKCKMHFSLNNQT